LHDHPHIGMCRAGELQSTQHAIDIFRRVVQLGLEGIVIVNPEVVYGQIDFVTRQGDLTGTFFKLKQKVVLPGMKFERTGPAKDVWKDGVKQVEKAFTATVDGERVNFTDLQDRETGHARIKYMEHVPGMGNKFPCQSGYRHMHFAMPQDMSVMVPAAEVPERNWPVENILGWDGTVDRIRSWDRDEDRQELEQLPLSSLMRLYNTRLFVLPQSGDIVLEPEGAIVIVDDEDEGEAAAPVEKRQRGTSLVKWGRRSAAPNFDSSTHPGPQSSASDVRALLNRLAECM
jgi:hypothetical protein